MSIYIKRGIGSDKSAKLLNERCRDRFSFVKIRIKTLDKIPDIFEVGDQIAHLPAADQAVIRHIGRCGHCRICICNNLRALRRDLTTLGERFNDGEIDQREYSQKAERLENTTGATGVGHSRVYDHSFLFLGM